MLDIVDAQVHITHEGCSKELAVMDALGISFAILDEFWGYDEQRRTLPFAKLFDGWFRPLSPNSQAAALLHPGRFAWIQRVERRDTQVHKLLTILSEAPGCIGVRIDLRGEGELQQLADGGYDELLTLAGNYQFPVSVLSRQGASAISRAATRLPNVRFLVDHCGHPASNNEWNEILALSQFKNVWLKWCLAESIFKDDAFPFPIAQAQLRLAANRFSVERIVWASNVTVARPKANLSQLLEAVLRAPSFSSGELEWLVGRAARALYEFKS